MTTIMLGTDWRRGEAVGGIILLRSNATGGFAENDPQRSARIKANLTGLVPWVGRQKANGQSLWAAFGTGRGELTHSLNMSDSVDMTADLSWSMAAAGAEGAPASLGTLGGAEVSWHADATWTRTETAEMEGLPAASAETSRLRLGLKTTWEHSLAQGNTLSPSLEIGLRYDGGDAETGFGIDIGGGIRYSDPVNGITVSANARTLALHNDGNFDDRGLSVEFKWDPYPDTRIGPSISATRGWGAASTDGMATLLEPEALPGFSQREETGTVLVEAAWGTALATNQPDTVGSVYGRITGNPGTEDVRVGWRVEPDEGKGRQRSHIHDLWLEPGTNGEQTGVGTELAWKRRVDGVRSSTGVSLSANHPSRLEAGIRVALQW